MKRFNLSDWALEHRSLVWYFMIVFIFAGWWSYWDLGREEDPTFTIKTMVIQANWPGASAEETTRQVTERIERKLEELDNLEWTRSITTAGNRSCSLTSRIPCAATRCADLDAGAQHDRRHPQDFPAGIVGPTFNDRFGDVFGNIYAFTADGLSSANCATIVEEVRAKVLTVPNIAEARIIGAQDEVIFLEFSTAQDRGARPRSAGDPADAAGAERDRPVRRRAGRSRAHRRARRRAVHIGGEPARHQPARQRPLLPSEPTSRPSPAATPIRPDRCSASTASRRSGSRSA